MFASLYKHTCDIAMAKVMSTVESRQTVAANMETEALERHHQAEFKHNHKRRYQCTTLIMKL